ncbi:MAG TPA: hypothetical protein VHS06_03325 [Chloroflexota bacterium]|nr:hypothetical protein [Chloroflexota bacterium]
MIILQIRLRCIILAAFVMAGVGDQRGFLRVLYNHGVMAVVNGAAEVSCAEKNEAGDRLGRRPHRFTAIYEIGERSGLGPSYLVSIPA